jgi:phosphoglucosamine mutase
MLAQKQSLRGLLKDLTLYPQLLVNVRFKGNSDPLSSELVKQAQAKAENKLGDSGRVLLRKSGTEPLLRVMVEGADSALVEQCANDIAEAVRAACD